MKSEEKISIRKYADSLAVSEGAIRKAISEGKIKKGFDKSAKKIIPSIADKEYGHLHKVAMPRPGQNKVKLVEKMEQPAPKKKQVAEPAPQNADDDLDDEGDLISNMKITKDLGYSETLRRRELIGLALDKKKLQEMERVLVRKDEVEKVLFTIGVELKKSLLNIPARITADVRSAANDVQAQTIITVELTQILNQFSNLQELKL